MAEIQRQNVPAETRQRSRDRASWQRSRDSKRNKENERNKIDATYQKREFCEPEYDYRNEEDVWHYFGNDDEPY